MKRLLIILLIGISCYGQEKVKLRDLTLSVPEGWQRFSKEEYEANFGTRLNYEEYYEVGGFFSDKKDVQKTPFVKYQYYSIPDMHMLRFDTLVKERIQSHRQDYGRLDTIVENKGGSYFYVSFEKYGKEVFYAQMLGKNGTLHVQWFTDPAYKKATAVQFENFLSGVKFNELYYDSNAIADMHEKRAGESSKFIFIFGGLALFIYIIRKMLIKHSSE